MKTSYLTRTLLVMGVSAACAWGMVGCSSDDSSADGSGSGAVAATVNGTDISEDSVTSYIETYRSNYGLDDEDAWGQALAQSGMTPAEFRDSVIDSFVTREIIRADESRGVTVDSSEVDSYVEQMKANYDSDEKWQEALEQTGMTEEDYREEIELQLKSKGIMESFTPEGDPSEEDQLQYAQMYASSYDGAKRSSHILFSSDDEQTAQEVLDKINAGELDFADAAKEYSVDSASAEQGGDVGWDCMTQFVEDYTNALADLDKGQVSGLVTSDYGIHIIECTDVYNAPKGKDDDGNETVKVTSLDQIPSDWLEDIKTSVNGQKQNEDYQQWLEDQKESADIVINDMPEGLPYDVDVSKYQTEDGTDESADSSDGNADEGTSDETTDSASDESAGGSADSDAADGESSDGNGDAADSDASGDESSEQVPEAA